MAPTKKPEGTERIADQKSIVFFHPDLGIGGAERLIVDAAVGLQELGHKVTIFTSHCDPTHCFEEARDGTLDVHVRGNILPPSILNRFHILLAILRQVHLVLSISIFSDELSSLKPDVFIVDQLSACVPLLRWIYPKKQRTLFYCHFPDQLLVRDRGKGVLGVVKKIYRSPFDWFEGWSTGASDKIVVNSNFTKSVAKRTFVNLDRDLDVIYPCIPSVQKHGEQKAQPLWNGKYKVLLSINRFERKKDIGLAIRAYAALSTAERQATRLILAGGYDLRIQENVQYHDELVNLAGNSGLRATTAKTIEDALAVPSDVEVLFLLSVPGSLKELLLQNAQLLLYTPVNEHFGIVPVEAMQHGVPVLASNTGGPLESIVENETGWLRDVTKVEEWTAIIRRVLNDSSSDRLQTMRLNGKKRVEDNFTRPKMASRFQEQIFKMLGAARSEFIEQKDIFFGLAMAGVFLAGLLMAIMQMTQAGKVDYRATEFARIRRETRARREQPSLVFRQE